VATRAPERAVEAWSGVRLSDLLAEAGMFFMTDGEALAAQVVVVTGADGSHTVLAASEVGPEYAHAPVLLATHRDGVRLADEAIRLVVPFDRTDARSIASVVAIELRTG
jgi:DMSO/TMAO reductase YedYZ molybdopterin-dependent catalytic subunit